MDKKFKSLSFIARYGNDKMAHQALSQIEDYVVPEFKNALHKHGWSISHINDNIMYHHPEYKNHFIGVRDPFSWTHYRIDNNILRIRDYGNGSSALHKYLSDKEKFL